MFVHSSRILKQIEYLKSRGIPYEQLYVLADIKPEEVLDPKKMFSFMQFHYVLEYAIEKTGDNYYGLRMGKEPHIAGTVGMLAASCRNLKEAFQQGCKFFKIQGDFADISFIEDSQFPKIEYSITNAWRLQFPETARHEVDAMFSFLSVVMKINSNGYIRAHRINLCREKPTENDEYLEAFGIVPFFGQEKNEMIFKERDLLIPMKAFNPETFQLLKVHIETQLKRFANQETIGEKVRTILLSSLQYQFPDIETVALKMHISPRTLQRQLTREKTNFQTILQDTKFEMAMELLKRNDLTISEIGFTLGYSDLANFSRSFKKYSGLSPQAYRTSPVKSDN